MAEFCCQCSSDLFDMDSQDLANLCGQGKFIRVLCEGCGPTVVDHKGRSIDVQATAAAYNGEGSKAVIR